MIINFEVKNWMSFQRSAEFSMVASREKRHRHRTTRLAKYQTNILPIAAIYGGNASGKTNLFRALSFAKNLVVQGTKPDGLIGVRPFKLNPRSTAQPTSFRFELLIQDFIYELSFSVTQHNVVEEKLVKISSRSEKCLYHRHSGKCEFHESLPKQPHLNFAFEGTRDNQLFLHNSVSQKMETFRPIYDWFNHTLELVAPDSRFEPFEQFFDEDHVIYNTMNELLPKLDTGIDSFCGELVPIDSVPIPPQLRDQVHEQLKEGGTLKLALNEPLNDRYVITRKQGELVCKKLVTYHVDEDGNKTKFDVRDESDGSRRIIDLLPHFTEIMNGDTNKVYVIDEVDRSLHTLLTRRLLELYLASRNTEGRSQLLVTTHDVLLMDQALLRRDEMWLTERDNDGSSKLVPFSEFEDVRYDKDIRKSYLQGRLGGIPDLRVYAAEAAEQEYKVENG